MVERVLEARTRFIKMEGFQKWLRIAYRIKLAQNSFIRMSISILV